MEPPCTGRFMKKNVQAHLEFSESEFCTIRSRCDELGVIFFSTAMDVLSADLLLSMGLPAVKVGSGDANNWRLMEHLGRRTEVRSGQDVQKWDKTLKKP